MVWKDEGLMTKGTYINTYSWGGEAKSCCNVISRAISSRWTCGALVTFHNPDNPYDIGLGSHFIGRKHIRTACGLYSIYGAASDMRVNYFDFRAALDAIRDEQEFDRAFSFPTEQ